MDPQPPRNESFNVRLNVGKRPLTRVVITLYSPVKGEPSKTQIERAPKDMEFQPGHVAAKVEKCRLELEGVYGVPYKSSRIAGLGLQGSIYYHIFPVPAEELPKMRLVKT